MIHKRVLILSPHTDDGEISAGGAIVRFIEEGKDVFYVAFSSCEKSVEKNFPGDILKKECKLATGVLGIDNSDNILLDYEVREFPHLRQEILEDMIKLKKDICPDLVITPSSFDTHQDHQVIYNETLRAFKKSASIFGMEHPWNNLNFRTDIFIELNEAQVMKKIDALKQYTSQNKKDYFDEKYLRAHLFTRGMNIGVKYAEVFECIRLKL
ncbi:MAG TPA: PIG-L family deacetylase [Methanocella sp.]|uniref:PIG-L deacetylase family protein n=1 Tax=Methanocella sp. TaxID=2052833 RepID=UPI002C50A01E|nr:PIG-L family deacetylase [Methanocella sp.]HTY90746.1 PIG-L family deacetylase [Methanocella sp.]